MRQQRDKSKERTFDYDSAFQGKLVRLMVQDEGWCISFCVPHLQPELFENNVHRWAAERTIGYATKYAAGITRSALRIEAKHAFTSGRLVRKRDLPAVNALLKLIKKPVADRSYIQRELFKFIKTQTLKEVVQHDVIEAMKRGEVDAYDSALQRVLDVQPPTEDGYGHSMSEGRLERFKRRTDWKPEGIATGLEVDQHIKHGGPRKKQLAAVVAPPHVGKTTVLVQLCKQAVLLGNQRCLFITLEEDEETIQDRLDSSFTGIDINQLEDPKNSLKVRKYWRRFRKNHDHEMLVVKEFPMGVTTVLQIERYIKSLERKGFYPDVVFVDYAGLLKPGGKTDDSRYEDIGTIYVELRGMGQRHKFLVWTAHQGNRDSMGKKVVTMRDLAESFKPAMHADLLLAICQTEQERDRQRARIFSMKVRGGRAHMEYAVKLDYNRVRVVNLT